MHKGRLQQTWVRCLLTALTAAVMVMIFCFSMETAEKSDETSGNITGIVIDVFYPEFEEYPATEQEQVYSGIQVVVRKMAHYSEYTLLGLLIRLCMESWYGYRMKRLRTLSLGAFGAGTIYACTDEAHQLAIDGRAGLWTDVLVDAGGVLAGILIAALLIRLMERMNEKRNRGEEDGILQEQ